MACSFKERVYDGLHFDDEHLRLVSSLWFLICCVEPLSYEEWCLLVLSRAPLVGLFEAWRLIPFFGSGGSLLPLAILW